MTLPDRARQEWEPFFRVFSSSVHATLTAGPDVVLKEGPESELVRLATWLDAILRKRVATFAADEQDRRDKEWGAILMRITGGEQSEEAAFPCPNEASIRAFFQRRAADEVRRALDRLEERISEASSRGFLEDTRSLVPFTSEHERKIRRMIAAARPAPPRGGEEGGEERQ